MVNTSIKHKKILIFGSLPPPVGGVRLFVEKLYMYLSRLGIGVDLFPSDFRILRYDSCYINYSVPWKRFVAGLVGYLVARRVFLILHSSQLHLDSIFNRLCVFLVDGVITTSADIKKSIDEIKGSGGALLEDGYLYKEFLGVQKPQRSKSRLIKSNRFSLILFYQQSNTVTEMGNIYGADLMLGALDYLPSYIKVVWIDLSGDMALKVRDHNSVLRYFDRPVDLGDLFGSINLLVRPTAFDGTAFMVVEALNAGVDVLCSDVVDRPRGAKTFQISDSKNLAIHIEDALKSDSTASEFKAPSIISFLRFTLS